MSFTKGDKETQIKDGIAKVVSCDQNREPSNVILGEV